MNHTTEPRTGELFQPTRIALNEQDCCILFYPNDDPKRLPRVFESGFQNQEQLKRRFSELLQEPFYVE